MSQFLDTLKERFADAQRRLQAATQRLQLATAEHQAVTQEFGSWQNAINVEARREQIEAAKRQAEEEHKHLLEVMESRAARSSTQPTSPPVVVANPPNPVAAITNQPESQPEAVNKTDLIRNVLRQHPNGITPVDVWREVKDRIDRNYVYSVLKRLKDSKQASERRGRYYLQVMPKSQDDKEESPVVN